MSAHEDRIRDELSARLSMIERGLTLIGINYALPNSAGTRGFIDILARDRHGVFVVIELKRSDKTAREALHEVMKYTELLQRERGIGSTNIRAAIVSTHWNELRVPFAHFKRGWANEIRGYMLSLGQDGITPLKAEEVKTYSEAPVRGISAVHLMIFPRTGNNIEKVWRESTKVLSAVGADDVLGVELAHDETPRLQYTSCLYLIIGSMIADDPRTIMLDKWREDVPDDSMEAPLGYALEYRALCHLTSGYNYDELHIETGYPEHFAAARSQNWRVCRVLRAGVFNRQGELYPDEVLLENIADRSGHSDVRFSGSSRPANAIHFAEFRKKCRPLPSENGCLARLHAGVAG
jgi:hypothetical protein